MIMWNTWSHCSLIQFISILQKIGWGNCKGKGTSWKRFHVLLFMKEMSNALATSLLRSRYAPATPPLRPYTFTNKMIRISIIALKYGTPSLVFGVIFLKICNYYSKSHSFKSHWYHVLYRFSQLAQCDSSHVALHVNCGQSVLLPKFLTDCCNSQYSVNYRETSSRT